MAIYSFTVNAREADPKKLFVYTLYKDGSMQEGFAIDTEKACAILTFPKPQNITADQLLAVWQKAKHTSYYRDGAEEVVVSELLGGREDVICLAFFNW